MKLTGLLDRRHLAADAAAGITVAAMLVPQAMAYALLAGLPPEVGLYASTLPLLLYALFGTSAQLAVGPVAIVSLLTASALAGVAEEGTAGYLGAAAVLSILVAAIHLIMAGARLGFLVRLLSHPVLVGFTAAAALIIGTSQAKHVLGVQIQGGDRFFEALEDVLRVLGDTHLLTFAVGMASIAVMVAVRRIAAAVPGALVAVVLSILASIAFDLESRGVSVVGDIPQGLPAFGLPGEWGLVGSLIPAALVITLVGFMESIAVAKVYARRNAQRIDPNRELLGLGLANLGAGVVGGYPVTGGFSRTAVNADAGAKTRFAAVITAAVVLLVIVALTPLFSQLPAATLGAIVLVAVAKLFDVAEIRHIASVKRADFVTLVVAFVATLGLGVELGIGVAAAASLVVIAARMMTPHTAVLGRLPGTTTYRNIDRFEDAEQFEGIAIIRFDVSLSYLNVEFMKRRVARLLHDRPDVSDLVIDMSGVNDVDASAADALGDLLDDLAVEGVAVHLAGTKGPVRDVLARAGLDRRLDGRIHPEVDAAIGHLQASTPGEHRTSTPLKEQ